MEAQERQWLNDTMKASVVQACYLEAFIRLAIEKGILTEAEICERAEQIKRNHEANAKQTNESRRLEALWATAPQSQQ